ncbi:MAG: hypothetical protein A4E73_00375 [Syntrophaceae bacterium PtaU1.Bin231]|nr:MAG: hypothetical protein A4E73_00375 [Syntrophaceae bacterium PtaU1.Bin231]
MAVAIPSCGEKRGRLDGAGPVFQIPVPPGRVAPRLVRRCSHVRAGQGSQRLDEPDARLARRHVAAVEEDVRSFFQGLAPGGNLRGPGLQHPLQHRRGTEAHFPLTAVREDMHGVQAFVGLEDFRDLSDAVFAGVEDVDEPFARRGCGRRPGRAAGRLRLRCDRRPLCLEGVDEGFGVRYGRIDQDDFTPALGGFGSRRGGLCSPAIARRISDGRGARRLLNPGGNVRRIAGWGDRFVCPNAFGPGAVVRIGADGGIDIVAGADDFLGRCRRLFHHGRQDPGSIPESFDRKRNICGQEEPRFQGFKLKGTPLRPTDFFPLLPVQGFLAAVTPPHEHSPPSCRSGCPFPSFLDRKTGCPFPSLDHGWTKSQDHCCVVLYL